MIIDAGAESCTYVCTYVGTDVRTYTTWLIASVHHWNNFANDHLCQNDGRGALSLTLGRFP